MEDNNSQPSRRFLLWIIVGLLMVVVVGSWAVSFAPRWRGAIIAQPEEAGVDWKQNFESYGEFRKSLSEFGSPDSTTSTGSVAGASN